MSNRTKFIIGLIILDMVVILAHVTNAHAANAMPPAGSVHRFTRPTGPVCTPHFGTQPMPAGCEEPIPQVQPEVKGKPFTKDTCFANKKNGKVKQEQDGSLTITGEIDPTCK